MAHKQLKLWFDKELALKLADKLIANGVTFDKNVFAQKVDQGTKDLELKDRVELIADLLKQQLAVDYTIAVTWLVGILGPENEKETGMFKAYYWVMPIAKYVEKYGLQHFDLSMNAIQEITKRNTGEYTIRPYLKAFPERTLKVMEVWSKDKNKHLRRLSSEGVRPRLPWAAKLDVFIEDPTPILPILENLKDDPSKYVQKSVANCINDILKDHPRIGKDLIDSWLLCPTKERKWIVKHALRNLLKLKDSWASGVLNQE
ncbi:DNA alkylation repair protein [Ulvibacterium marinum]|uniref:3-methyladenine DNA glycosylase n=1 Tax=Ulvibacterium marinum TaxID=2419782 RepID=A0A3B0CC97_9FLAO|nr:DNA alkylation repair protein [Ulvibacterium marinum]RKN81267.1 3-methyladenine DNA glycosylase [Ulvibacterium marinum]